MTTRTTDARLRAETGPTAQPMDRLLFLMMLMLIGIGIVSVYDATYAMAVDKQLDSFYFVKRQAIWAVIGFGAMLFTRRFPYWRLKTWGNSAVAISLFLLVGVLIPHVGHAVLGARRWIGVGPIQFQPSELAKVSLVLYLAGLLAGRPKRLHNVQNGLMPALAVVGILAALIAKEPDLGTALVLTTTGGVMLFLGGAKPRHMLGVAGAAVGAIALFILFEPYRMHRVITFLDPKKDQMGAGYQVWHALIALGSGGVTGYGLGEGREKLFIPEGSSDFIFPVIAEEWGLIGTLTLVTVFALIAIRGYSIAYKCRDPFGALLAAGITTIISVQSLLNIGVATSSIPNTGVPLPFISNGGTALVMMMAGIGLLLNISSYPDGPGVSRQEDVPERVERDWERRWERHGYGTSAQRPAAPRRASR